ncbi:ECF transporter S component [Enterococcus casseliflavus]|uniref:ECF transporter S component n=1 Tax=Enterococcus casseliflavus TaxID=37734 RepID=UPI001AD703DC|nr:ECF transporter S component [Enterococcus casseliflavus]MBO6359681.1 ECF transporter S component [Enterococcus casseliflavus]MBO6375759.1 ECF transporter S component [Enterococcus casseliflavus]
MNTKSKTYRLVIRAILTAIIILQTMVPFLGFIPIGITSLTIIHITVIVAAIVLGTKDGMFIGLVWGVFTMIRAFTSPTTPLDIAVFTNPIISVVPRVFVGLVAGLLFTIIYKKTKKVVAASIVAAIFGTITNTVLVLTLMGTLYTGLVANTYGVDASALFVTLGGIAITNGISEVITAAILTPILVKALFAATSLRPENR